MTKPTDAELTEHAQNLKAMSVEQIVEQRASFYSTIEAQNIELERRLGLLAVYKAKMKGASEMLAVEP